MGNLLTVEQVAEAIDLSKATVYRLVKQGILKAERNGYGILVRRTEVLRYCTAQRDEWRARIDRVRAA